MSTAKKLLFPEVKTKRIGKGTFGAKTLGLERFQSIVDKTERIVIPPFISIPIGFLNKAVDFRSREVDTSILDKTKLKEIYSLIHGKCIAYALRSDERTAKGIGLYITEFLSAQGDFNKRFEDFLYGIKTILRGQIEKDPQIFRKKLGLPQGIGIQIMPLAGSEYTQGFTGSEKHILPPVSVAGYTVMDMNEVILHAGYGIGGAVDKTASYSRISFDSDEDRFLLSSYPMIDGGSHIVFYKFFNTRNNRIDETDHSCLHLLDKSLNSNNLNPKIYELLPYIKQIAEQAGTDIYFEIQLHDPKENIWALTQIDEHTWPDVTKPEGEEIIRVEGFGKVLGSGVKEFVDDIWIKSFLSYEENVKRIAENPGSLIVVNNSIGNINFRTFSEAGGILCLEGFFGRVKREFSAHVSGALREAGIIVLDGRGSEMVSLRDPKGKKYKLYADEKNSVAGIYL